jgi:UDP:flavonoid glycosyltransferase YjiC (YdhE family)
LLLTRFGELVPGHLPDTVRHCPFVPLGRLLPRAAAIVSYGGIGTAARALAAGIPHVVTPHKHDQPENAARLTELGVARTIPPAQFRARTVASVLNHVLHSPCVAVRCGELAHRLSRADAVGETCRLIEDLVNPAQAKAA